MWCVVCVVCVVCGNTYTTHVQCRQAHSGLGEQLKSSTSCLEAKYGNLIGQLTTQLVLPPAELAWARLQEACFSLELIVASHEPVRKRKWRERERVKEGDTEEGKEKKGLLQPNNYKNKTNKLEQPLLIMTSLWHHTFSSRALWWSKRDLSAFSTSTSELTPTLDVCLLTTVIRSERSWRATRHSKCSSSNCVWGSVWMWGACCVKGEGECVCVQVCGKRSKKCFH